MRTNPEDREAAVTVQHVYGLLKKCCAAVAVAAEKPDLDNGS